MPVNVTKKERETSQNLVHRFTKTVRQSGILLQLRKNRFFETYKSRGLEDFDIEKLYLDRITDENEFIIKTQRYADWCLDSVDWVLQ